MLRWVLVLAVFLGMGASGAANAGSWSIGYTDYGRHGGYSLALGSHGYRSISAFSYAPSWGGYGYRDHYRARWSDPWYLSNYRAPARYYDDCYYGCARGYAYSSSGYYGYSPRYSYAYGPSYAYRSSYRPYGRSHYSVRYDRYDRHDRYDRYDRHDHYDRHDRHDRHDNYGRSDHYRGDYRRGDRYDYARHDDGRGSRYDNRRYAENDHRDSGRRNESAYERAREHSYTPRSREQ